MITEEMIVRVHIEEGERIGINLPIKFDADKSLAVCRYSYTRGAIAKIAHPAYEIAYNVQSLNNMLPSFLFFKKSRRKYAEDALRFIVRHEYRHAWQTLYNPSILSIGSLSCLDGLRGHGQKPWEKDANDYALSLDDNALTRALTLDQETCLLEYYDEDMKKKIISSYRELIKFNFKALFK